MIFTDLIARHYSSEVNEIPNEKITYEKFWSDPKYEKVPYDRGAIFAFFLDQKIIGESKGLYSLDDVMRKLLENSHRKVDHQYFVNTVNKYCKQSIQSYFIDFIENGKLIPLKSLFKSNDLNFSDSIEVRDIGFSYDSNLKVTAVNPKSNAFKAGLKVGDLIIKSDTDYKPGTLVRYSVKRKKEVLALEFYSNIKKLNIPQLTNDEKNLKRLSF